jgi:hypothetical protein
MMVERISIGRQLAIEKPVRRIAGKSLHYVNLSIMTQSGPFPRARKSRFLPGKGRLVNIGDLPAQGAQAFGDPLPPLVTGSKVRAFPVTGERQMYVSRRVCLNLLATFVALAAIASTQAGAQQPQKPNVVFILADNVG